MHELVSQKSVTSLVGEELPDTLFFFFWFPVRWCWLTKFPLLSWLFPSISALLSLSRRTSEHIHTWIAWFPSKLYARHKTTPSPSKTMKQCTKRQCVIIHTAYCYIHTLYNVLLPCLPGLSLSLFSSFFHLDPTPSKQETTTLVKQAC